MYMGRTFQGEEKSWRSVPGAFKEECRGQQAGCSGERREARTMDEEIKQQLRTGSCKTLHLTLCEKESCRRLSEGVCRKAEGWYSSKGNFTQNDTII